MSLEDKERLSLEEEERGRTSLYLPPPPCLTPEAANYPQILTLFCGSGVKSTWTPVAPSPPDTHTPEAPPSLFVLREGAELCCHPVAAPAAAPLRREAPKQSGFPGIRRRAQLWPNKTFITITTPPPSVPPPLELMNHQHTFHGVRVILIKRSRALFFPGSRDEWGVRDVLPHIPAPRWEDWSRKQLGEIAETVRPLGYQCCQRPSVENNMGFNAN